MTQAIIPRSPETSRSLSTAWQPPILYASKSQATAIIPYEMAGRTVSTVVAARYFQHGLNSVISVLLAATSPGVFIAAVNGVSPDGILNYGTPPLLNSPANGGGIWNNTPQYGPGNPHIDGLDGSIALTALMFQQGQASLTIGGQPAVIEYAGAAPYQIWGIPQINAVVPAGLAPGPQPVVLTIGQNSTAS